MFTERYGLFPYIKQIMFGVKITVVETVYRAVRTDCLYKADYVWSLNNRGRKGLQRRKDSYFIYSRLRLVFK